VSARLGLILLLVLRLAAAPAPKRAAPRTSVPVRRWMRSMTLRDKIAQLVFIPFHGAAPNVRTREYRRFMKLVRETHVGGLVLVNWSQGRVTQKAEPHALAAFLNRMQRVAKVPLIVTADFERGASMRVDETTVFPHAMAFGATGDPSLARYEGQITAREARALGVQWVFFPVADVNSNPDNPIINIRSFGENPEQVAKFVTAFIDGARADPKTRVLTTAKHFPGHGDTAVDTHLNLAVVSGDRARLEAVEWAPFRAAIKDGVDSIMTAHIAVPALSPAELPATLSPAILTGLLRGEMGFQGIVVTDALEMGGIAKGYSTGEAAVKAIEAGADGLVMPPDPDAAIRAVLAAVRSGQISEQRINESVERLLGAKQRVGLDRRRFVDLEAISDEVNSPESNQRAQEISNLAVTLVKNEKQVLPLAAPAKACYLTLAEGHYSTEGQAFAREVRRRVAGARITALDATMPVPAPDAGCESFVVAAFASVAAYAGDVALKGDYPKLIESLLASGKPVVLVALGNPYLLRSFPHAAAYLATFSTVAPSEVAAVKALFGEIAIRGHLPVTIPGVAKCGEGLMVPARAAPAVSGK
jgi:beta-N-acetylhexosaminidase